MTSPNRPPSCDLPPEFYKEELKPCPDCGGEAVHGYIGNNSVIACSDLSCQMMGPNNDTQGHKWNSIPRRSEVAGLLRLVDNVTEWRDDAEVYELIMKMDSRFSDSFGSLIEYSIKLRKEWKL